jgi:SAM-dependent methyltransferase
MRAMQAEAWQDGDLYEPYVGRWSRAVAATFVDWLEVPMGGRWLDVGCGTGALSETVLLRAEPVEVKGIDQSEGFVKYARQHLEDPRFDAQVGDARSLPFEDGSFDAVVSGLMLNFIPDQGGVANELARVAAPGATVGVYVWDYAGGMQMMRYFWDAAKDLDPRAREQDEGERFAEIASLKGLGSLFDLANLGDVRSRSIDVPTIFRDFDDYWSPFAAGQGPAPAYCASLDDGKQAELRELLRVRLPTKTDGTIRLTARAWAVQGTRPQGTQP